MILYLSWDRFSYDSHSINMSIYSQSIMVWLIGIQNGSNTLSYISLDYIVSNKRFDYFTFRSKELSLVGLRYTLCHI
jgi:hypothetical protein